MNVVLQDNNPHRLIKPLTKEDQEKFTTLDIGWQLSIIGGDNEVALKVRGEIETLMNFYKRKKISLQTYKEVQNLVVAQVIRYIQMDKNDIIAQWYSWDLRITPEWIITRESDNNDSLPL